MHPVSEEANLQRGHSSAGVEMDDREITQGGKFNLVSMFHFPLREDVNPGNRGLGRL